MAASVCTQSEIFFGWTLAELEALRTDLKGQIQDEGLDHVTTVGINGKSAGLGQRMSLEKWMVYLRAALQELDPLTYGAPVRVTHAAAGYGGYMPK